MPRKVAGVNMRHLLHSRAITCTLPPYYDESAASKAVAKVFSPLKRMFWSTLERVIQKYANDRGLGLCGV